MTRADFEYNVNNMEDLVEFCRDNDCPILSDAEFECELDTYVCEDIRDATTYDTWVEIKEKLESLHAEWHGDWFIYGGRFDYTFISEDDFDYYYERVLDWAIDEDFFDPEEEEEEEDEDLEEEASELTEFSESEPVDICSLFGEDTP